MGSTAIADRVRAPIDSPMSPLIPDPCTSRERRIIEDNPPRTSAAALLAENPYTPTVTVVNAILASSPMLRELVVIREWVQDFAPPPPRPESTTGYLRGTKNALAQAARMGAPPPEWRVQTLDPDATHHGDEKTLDPDDMVRCRGVLE